MNSSEEKRVLSRINYKIGAHIRHKDTLVRCEILNCSLNGFLVKTGEALDAAEGEEIILEVDFSNQLPVFMPVIDCYITRKTDDFIGLRFRIIDYDTLMFLKEQLGRLIGDQDKIDLEFSNFL